MQLATIKIKEGLDMKKAKHDIKRDSKIIILLKI